MALRRTTLILLIVLGVVVAAAVVGYFLYPDRVKDVFNGSLATNSAANINTRTTNTSDTPANLSTVQDLKGEIEFAQTFKVGLTEITFTTLDRLSSFDQTPAPDGQQYVVLYFNGVEASATMAVWSVLRSAQLVDGQKTYSPDKLKVATKVVKNDQGYVVFVTPKKTGTLTLESGTGTELKRLALP